MWYTYMLFQFNTGFYRSVCQISHDLLTVKSHGCPVLQQFFEWDGLTAMGICTSLCDKKLNLVFWLLKGNRLQKVKRGKWCHFLLWLYVQVLQHFLSKRNVAVSPYAHPSILFSGQKLHILPFNLIFLRLSCYTYFFFLIVQPSSGNETKTSWKIELNAAIQPATDTGVLFALVTEETSVPLSLSLIDYHSTKKLKQQV